jgi:EAL domain-containing protein (putative c-di-GMP-specific phosphodiesterase class I)
MKIHSDSRTAGCDGCSDSADLGFDLTMAFQPIVNATTQQIFAHEALVRGLQNQPAGEVFSRVNETNRYRFDQLCRVKAIELAAKLAMPCMLSINFMPNAVYQPERCIRTTLEAAHQYGFPIDQIIFEITEGERVEDIPHLKEIVSHYQERGFKTAIDDFGAGYAGLNLLAEIQTDLIKLDMALIRHIDQNKTRQAIVKGIIQVCRDLSITVIAEGVETYEELEVLKGFGVELFQGYHFARPAFEALAAVPGTAYASPR